MLINYIKMAKIQLRKNVLRTVLTAIGIVAGVATIIMVFSLGDAGQLKVNSELDRFGIKRIYVLPEEGETLRRADAELIENSVQDVEYVCPMANAKVSIVHNGELQKINLNATTYALEDMEYKKMLYGRFLSEQDELYAHKVVVLQKKVATKFFGDKNPCGEKIELLGSLFEIVGVEVDDETIYSTLIGNKAYITLSAYEQLSGKAGLSEISVLAQRSEGIEKVTQNVENLMGAKYENLRLINLSKEVGIAQNILNIFALVIAAIALISMLVGGVGIMNIMLVSVRERTREIGIRKALGATSRSIGIQFLIESIIYSLIGGGMGIFVGTVLSGAIGRAIELQVEVSLTSILVGMLFSAVIGVVFGVVPAYRASKLKPIDALRAC